jgi:phosphoglycerate dehydrogenase-like enzyme
MTRTPNVRPLPAREQLTICFAHPAYRLAERFAVRDTGLRHFEVRSLDDLRSRLAEAQVLVVSGLWRNELVTEAPQLAFIQSISAGVDQYDRQRLEDAGIRLASAQGANERAVSEHALALLLALARKLPMARDNQTARRWRGLVSAIDQREDELGGKILVIVGMGRIGSRLARLARALDMRVIGVKRDASRGAEAADQAVPTTDLLQALAEADYVALTCPLTDETRGLLDARAFAALRPHACLVNVARGAVVDEAALVQALQQGRLAAAAVDCVQEEPLPQSSPLWGVDNLLITPHSAGETRRYEDNVIDLLLENLERGWSGNGWSHDTDLKNAIV